MKNKRKWISISLALMIATSSIGLGATTKISGVTKENYKFEINGEMVNIPSTIHILSKDNTTYVPLRFLSENMGATVGFKQGTIFISGIAKQDVSLESEKASLESALRELEQYKKENADLKKRISELSRNIDDKNLYRALPVVAEDGAGFKINVRQAQKNNINDLKFDITISNSDKMNAFFLKADKTVLTLNGSSYPLDSFSPQLLSTIAPVGESLGKSSYDGELYFKDAYGSEAKGSITFYYNSNNSPSEKSLTLFFDLSK